MVAKDGSNGAWQVTQQAIVLLLTLRFVSLPNKRPGGPRNTKVCGICRCTNVLNSNSKMLIKTLLKVLLLICLWYCFQQVKNLCYRLMPFQNCFIIHLYNYNIRYYYIISLNGFINYKLSANCPFSFSNTLLLNILYVTKYKVTILIA